jgi:hypothetical protein
MPASQRPTLHGSPTDATSSSQRDDTGQPRRLWTQCGADQNAEDAGLDEGRRGEIDDARLGGSDQSECVFDGRQGRQIVFSRELDDSDAGDVLDVDTWLRWSVPMGRSSLRRACIEISDLRACLCL